MYQEEDRVIIAIASGKGGCGKTTTTLALATVLRREGLNPLVIDLDPGASATGSAGVEVSDDAILDLLHGDCDLSSAIVKGKEGYDLVPGSEKLIAFAVTDVAELAQRLRALSVGRNVLIDTAQGTTLPVTRAALAAADLVVIPVQPEPKVVERSYNGVIAMLDLYDSAAELLFVATMAQQNLALTRNQLTNMAKKGIELGAIIPRGVACSEADLYSQSVVAYQPKSQPARAYEDLARTVIARINKENFRKPKQEISI